MKGQRRIRDFGVQIGSMKPGEKNAITDISGVKVGHSTLKNGDIQTGVTAILPHEGNLFQKKVVAAIHVINGFGKTMGAIQVEELGNIETPIVLTNTLSIGTASDALIEYMLNQNSEIGLTTGTMNPIVGECNDSFLNDIRGRHITKEHVFEALTTAESEFEEGAVGAGAGMSCYQLKGGIGTASRVCSIGDKEYGVGVLVLSNMGGKEDLMVNGKAVGKAIIQLERVQEIHEDKGSIIIVVATDLPLSERQLKRMAKRAGVGLARTGSYIGHGSGDIVIAFTTADKVNHEEIEKVMKIERLHENYMDMIFRAVAESTEEAILNSMITADTTIGRAGNTRISLKEYIHAF